MVSGIYQIKCIENGKVYIGKANDVGTRWRQHMRALELGKHTCKPLQRDYDKYGFESLEFRIMNEVYRGVVDIPEKELMDTKECYWGKRQHALDSSTGYNYISRYYKEVGDIGSMTMLNKLRVDICSTIGTECYAIYSAIVAHFDYGKGFSIVNKKMLARETGLEEKNMEYYFTRLEKGKFIKETFLDEDLRMQRCFKVRRGEADNLQWMKELELGEKHDPENHVKESYYYLGKYVPDEVELLEEENKQLRKLIAEAKAKEKANKPKN